MDFQKKNIHSFIVVMSSQMYIWRLHIVFWKKKPAMLIHNTSGSWHHSLAFWGFEYLKAHLKALMYTNQVHTQRLYNLHVCYPFPRTHQIPTPGNTSGCSGKHSKYKIWLIVKVCFQNESDNIHPKNNEGLSINYTSIIIFTPNYVTRENRYN